MRILLLIRSWNRGGAERQFAQLAHALARRGHQVRAVSLYPGGVFAGLARAGNAEVIDLGKKGRYDLLAPLWRLLKLVRRDRPEVIYSFMPAANLMASLVRIVSPRSAIVWGIRAMRVDPHEYGRLSRLSHFIQRQLIRMPDAVICNSEASRREIAQIRLSSVSVIENGIDIARFRPDSQQRSLFRNSLGIAPDTALVGIVGRLDPMKGHRTFLEAAALIRAEVPDVHFIVVGSGEDQLRWQLRDLAAVLNLGGVVSWCEAKDEVEEVYNGLDVFVSSSYSESFPNVVAEAMACGVPVVVTNVGDSARIVGSAGRVVEPRSAQALSRAVLETLGLERGICSASVRARIECFYSMGRGVERTEALLARIAKATTRVPT